MVRYLRRCGVFVSIVATAFGAGEAVRPADPGHIHVDQFGYLPAAEKVAVISDPQQGFNANDHYTPGKRLEVRRVSDDTVVYAGGLAPFQEGRMDPVSGDRGWWFDFSAVNTPGRYYIIDPSTQARSPQFEVNINVYVPVLRAAVRMFYYQRQSIAHAAPYAEAPWQDGPAFLQDSATRSVAKRDDPSTARDLSGGWNDAGDTNKYPSFLAEVIHPLLYAWRANPTVFTDDFGIPESGNGRPDLLDEVKWELDWLIKMQGPDGGLPIKMGMPVLNGEPPSGRAISPYSQDHRPRYYGPTCSASTIVACGVYAHAARVYARFPEWRDYAAKLRTCAEAAWKWYTTHPRSYDCDQHEIMSGSANLTPDEQDTAEAVAAMHLWVLTARKEFHDAFRARAGQMRQLKESPWSYYLMGQGEVLLDYVREPHADPALRDRILSAYTRALHSPLFLPTAAQNELYRAAMPESCYDWGSNRTLCCFGIVAVAGLDLDLDAGLRARMRERGADLVHALHGVNPLGLVYLTHMDHLGATLSVEHVYHEWFGQEPPPGYLAGGPDRNYDGTLAWVRDQPPAKAYVDTSEGGIVRGYEITEPAIYYQACYIRLLSSLMR